MYPSLYRSDDLYREAYEPRIKEFMAEGLEYRNFLPAPRVRNGVILIDCQRDFMDPNGSLFVPGSPDDLLRIIEFIYQNIFDITSIYASLDTHVPMQIFFPAWWNYVYTRQQPEPFAIVTREPAGNRGVDERGELLYPTRDSEWTLYHYLTELTEPHVLWPEHCLIGTSGHSLVSPLQEALAFWSAVTKRSVTYIIKGMCPQVEHFGIFGAEVPYPSDPSTFLNVALLERIKEESDFIYFAGVAKSHCVRKSEWQALRYYPSTFRSRITHLDDASSSVMHQTIDFDAIAEADLAEMEKLGLRRAKSTDPIWK